MKTVVLYLLIHLFGFFISVQIVLGMDAETIENMPFLISEKYCLECHTKAETKSYQGRTAQSCNEYCLTCHKVHHPVGKRISRNRPENLKYFKRNKMACFTCHNLHNKRYGKESWKSESLFESVFEDKDKHLTYYLVINNRKGLLCKQCH